MSWTKVQERFIIVGPMLKKMKNCPEWQEFSGQIEVLENATLGERRRNLTELFEIIFVFVRHRVQQNVNCGGPYQFEVNANLGENTN